jgi:hypothetical protein
MERRVRRTRAILPAPCPFCGQVPQVHTHFSDPVYSLIHRCPVIGTIMFDWTGDKVAMIRRWNTRHEK